MILTATQQKAYDMMKDGKNVFLTGKSGTGKCLAKGTQVLLFDGSVVAVEQVKVGDLVMGDDSAPRRVLALSSGVDVMYRVECSNNQQSYTVNSNHILTLKAIKTKRWSKILRAFVIVYGDQHGDVQRRHFATELEADAFAIGIQNVVDLPVALCAAKASSSIWRTHFVPLTVAIQFEDREVEMSPSRMGASICDSDTDTDRIPIEYKTNCTTKRMEFLTGFFDRRMEYQTQELPSSTHMMEDLRYIASSLGVALNFKENRIEIAAESHIEFIRDIGEGEYFGFEVDGNHRFVMGNFVVTHNSSVIRKFKKEFGDKKRMLMTSTTGTSALLIGGATLHSALGIGLGTTSVEALVFKIRSKSWLKKTWKDLKILIIDEISMLPPELFDKLEQVARLLRLNELPFGGVQLILTGDFCQLPCVKNERFCFEAGAWEKCIGDHVVYLTEIIRQKDLEFQACLNDVRVGCLSEKSKSLLQSRVGANLRNDRGIVPTKLFTRKMSVNRLNDEELDKLAAIGRPFFEYELSFMVLDATSGAKSNDILMEKFKDNTTCLPTLQLCVGAQVMLLVNLDLRNKLANGSRGVVIGFESELPKVRFLSGEDVVVDYHNWEIEDGKGNTVIIARQIPLKPAYAITVHHSQGMTLDCAEMDLSNVFEFSQTYVALSRVKSLEGLRLTAIDFDLIKAHPKALEYYNKLENKLINEAAAAATV